ncbi:response regulator [Brevundimonas sp.]|uniref:response regulator n=2 Tax=Brevundimonas sp. TaxID=1871086 RepID=UPI0024873F41|nr:response regulator [Brevundimonas sp.]MDI1282353.1 response regulator [Brevundimonas sp.]
MLTELDRPGPDRAGRPPLVLVVDDDPIMREVTRIHLEGAGYTVELATGGVEGVDKVEALRPDLVILDFAMPGVSGCDALRQIRAQPGSVAIPVIMLTAWSSVDDRKVVEALGGSWLEKPVSVEALLEAVRGMIAA